jgi:predicted enzyme related to lactoylglutathione lyase
VTAPVVWFEIVVQQFERAKRFYAELLGWGFERLEGYDEEYWTVSIPSSPIGGALAKSNSVRRPGGGSVVYVQVDDLETMVDAATKLGGVVIVPPKLITPTAGSFAVVADLDGNHIGFFKNEDLS